MPTYRWETINRIINLKHFYNYDNRRQTQRDSGVQEVHRQEK